MRAHLCLSASVLCLAIACSNEAPLESPTTARVEGDFAIVHVDVAPMDSDRILVDQTVLVKDGVVARLGPAAAVSVPEGTPAIDGHGLFLMPGLMDLHVHVNRQEELLMYLANGVTTVLNLRGQPFHLDWREELAAGTRFGPRMFTCGPFIRGHQVDAESAVAQAHEIAEAGYDCVKIYDEWQLEPYLAVAEATSEIGIPFMGHAPRGLDFEVVLADGREKIVHLEELVYTTPELDAWIERWRNGEQPGPEDDPRAALLEPVRALARATAEAGIWVVPTQIVIDNYRERTTSAGLERLAARPYLRYLNPVLRRTWARADQSHRRIRHEQQTALQHLMLEVFREAGVRLGLGTDASVEDDLAVMPGWSVHEELAILVRAGYTPYEALSQATARAAEYLELPGEGVVTEGARADLVLVNGNPFEAIENAADIVAVVSSGRWLSRGRLDDRLAELEATFVDLEGQIVALDEPFSRGAAAALAAFSDLPAPSPELSRYVEGAINRMGYDLLGRDLIDEAIATFTLNTEAFPDSANTYDSLAEAYLESGDREAAIRLYQQALAVDPEFANAARILRDLGVEAP
jgi:tetratricopeptide (TPR) repeat protein